MHSRADLLTALTEDWSNENVLRLRASLAASYVLAEERTDPKTDPFFNTPNRNFARGYLRWILLDSHLARACEAGFLNGITPYWVTVGDAEGSVRTLELRGKSTALMVHHLAHPTDPVRDSRLRFERRSKNEMRLSPFLLGFEPQTQRENADLVNITLVHGDKGAEFAYFRVYNDVLNLRSFVPVSENIMQAPQSVPNVDAEEVKEAEIILRKNPSARKSG